MPALGSVDVLWKKIDYEAKTYDVHVVSDVPLGDNFPNRELRYALDNGLVTDIYVVDTSNGQAVEVPIAKILVSLLQSSFKFPANAGAGLLATGGIPNHDISDVTETYTLFTSSYFSDFFVDIFIKGGLDNLNVRTDLYQQIMVDMLLQPQLADTPDSENRYQAVLDGSLLVSEFTEVMNEHLAAFESSDKSSETVINWATYQNSVAALAEKTDGFHDLKPATTSALDRLSDVLDGVGLISGITGETARLLLLQSIANERALLRLRVLEDFVDRAAAQPGADPALASALQLARLDVEAYVNDYYVNLGTILEASFIDNPDNLVTAFGLSKHLIRLLFGKAFAATYATVLTPYLLSFEVYNGIRAQEDRARTASLAATMQRELFKSHGLLHHRDLMHQPGALDAVEAQAFNELFQMSWYLSSRHFQDALGSLNNEISRHYGQALDFFIPGGSPYQEQMDELSRQLEFRRMVTQRLASPSYLSTVPQYWNSGPQDGEYIWLVQLIRGDLVTSPTAAVGKDLGICLTKPTQPNTPAILANALVRTEPNACLGSGDWECGPQDPDGVCTARFQLYWDDDKNPSNADCENGSGPCPIPGAEDLHPIRDALYIWDQSNQRLPPGDYYLYASITDGAHSASAYSPGSYTFIDPYFEAEHWSFIAREIREGGRSDGDGIPEIGEEISIDLLLQNISGRFLRGVKLHSLRVEGDAVRHLATDDWSEEDVEDRQLSFVIDGVTLFPDANDNDIVTATDDLQIWIGSESPTSIPLVASVEYWDDGNPVDPTVRRIQDIGFEVTVSDGSNVPDLRCDHIDLVDDTYHDGVFESGEKGYFTATVCNDGTWEAIMPWATFEDPPPLGRWIDEDSFYTNLSPSECQPSEDIFVLRTERDECGGIVLPMTVTSGSYVSETSCSLSVQCAPYQSIQDDVEAGNVQRGEPLTASIFVSNPGAATLTITGVAESSNAADTSIVNYPATLSPGNSGIVEISVDTTAIPPGRYTRTIRVDSNANNPAPDERESIVSFGVTDSDTPVQLSTNGVTLGAIDLSGELIAFIRGNDVYVLDARDGSEIRLTTTSEQESKPRIDGNIVVFVRRDSVADVLNIFYHDLDSGIETQVTNLAFNQIDPDIYGDTIVWEDQRTGVQTADIYKYVIGQDSINGSLAVDLGGMDAATDPRISDLFIGYVGRRYDNDGFFKRNLGYFDRNTNTHHNAGLWNDPSICTMGSDYDVSGNHAAFQCDCGDLCDRDDMVYYVNMATRSAPTRLTCDNSLGDDREEILIFGNEVFYVLDGDDDIYKTTMSNGCPNEVPLHIGSSMKRYPAGDAATGTYAFLDNQTGAYQIWGIVPPPAIEASVASFDLDASEFIQGGSYSFNAVVLNNGRDDLSSLPVRVTANAQKIDSWTVPTLPAGASNNHQGTWNTAGLAAGMYSLEACLAPAPNGDANNTNDCRSLTLELEDDDTSPPSLSNAEVAPGSGSDGDPYLEEGEAILLTWSADDSAGISATQASLNGNTVNGFLVAPGRYQAELPSQNASPNAITATIEATDGDDSPLTSSLTVPIVVYPARPTIIATIPMNGESDVDAGSSLEVTFSVDMNRSTIRSENFMLTDISGTMLSTIPDYDESTRTALIDADFQDGTRYHLIVQGGAGGVEDVRGNPLLGDFLLEFTTSDPTAVIFFDGFESGDTSVWSGESP